MFAALLHCVAALLHCNTVLPDCTRHIPGYIYCYQHKHNRCKLVWSWFGREQLSRLSVHVEIASKINKIIEAKDLTDVGKLEQDLVFGDATSKEIITYISANQKMSAEDKVCPACKPVIDGVGSVI